MTTGELFEESDKATEEAVARAVSNMAFDNYCEADGLNQSRAKKLLNLSPAHAIYEPEEEETSRAFAWGTAAHTLCLEPRKFIETVIPRPEGYPENEDLDVIWRSLGKNWDVAKDVFVAEPDWVEEKGRRVKAYKEWKDSVLDAGKVPVKREEFTHLEKHGTVPEKPWRANVGWCERWMRAHAEMLVVTRDEYQQCHRWRENLREKPQFDFFLGGDGHNELSLFWRDEKSGLSLKARIDRAPAHPGSPLVDFKTCRSAHPVHFGADAARLGYGFQAAWYLEGWNACFPDDYRDRMVLVALEKDAPNVVSFWVVPDEEIEAGRRMMRTVLDQWARCEESGEWPSYADMDGEEMFTYAIPKWRQIEIDQILGA